MAVSVKYLKKHDGETVTVRGWLAEKTQNENVAILEIRDGSGYVQAVVRQSEVSEEAWGKVLEATRESTVRITGVASTDARAPDGVEIKATDFTLKHLTRDLPSEEETKLPKLRHLWIRSKRTRAVLAIRSEVCQGIRDFFYEREFVLVDAPILTPIASDDRSTLFSTEYFGDRAFLARSGQLYLEPACAAFGKVYCMGPTFQAEEEASRRHLTEFWMVEPEVAFLDFEGLLRLAEELVCGLVSRLLDRCREELETLGRNLAMLERITPGFSQMTYAEAIDLLRNRGREITWGEELASEDEALLAEEAEGPVFVTRFPKKLKAFYMEPDPEDGDLVLNVDLLAPEGYGGILSGSERVCDHPLLLNRLREHDLPAPPLEWYLDVRRYGTFPHSGFGLGIERFVAWMCGLESVEDATAYPRTPRNIYP